MSGFPSFDSFTDTFKKKAVTKGNELKKAVNSTLDQVQSNQNVQKMQQDVQHVLERATSETSKILVPMLERIYSFEILRDARNVTLKFTEAITALREKDAFNKLFDDKINASNDNEKRKAQLLALRNILAQNINVFTYNDYRNNRFFNYEYILLILKNRLAVLRDIQGSIQGGEGRLGKLLDALKMDNTLKEYITGATRTKPKLTPLDLDESFFHALNDILLNFIGGKKQNQESDEESDKESSKQHEGLQTIINLFEGLQDQDKKKQIKIDVQNSVNELSGDPDRAKYIQTLMNNLKGLTSEQIGQVNDSAQLLLPKTPGGTRRNKTNQKKRKSSKRKTRK